MNISKTIYTYQAVSGKSTHLIQCLHVDQATRKEKLEADSDRFGFLTNQLATVGGPAEHTLRGKGAAASATLTTAFTTITLPAGLVVGMWGAGCGVWGVGSHVS